MTAPANVKPISPHRILIVDDEEIVLLALRETLARSGYQVVTANSPLTALTMAQKETYAVVISDQQMPGMSGLDFLLRVKALQPDASRILITAVLSLDTVIEAINRGEIYRFIVKPWLREELLVTVKHAVHRYELLVQNAVLQATTIDMNERLSKLNRSLEEQVKRVADQNGQLKELNTALSQNLNQSVQLCVHTLQTFCPTLGNHALRVFEICKAMSQTIEMTDDQKQMLEMAAWLHDIGLIGVPRPLIRKWLQQEGDLTNEELALVQLHPGMGQELSGFVHTLREVGTIIRAHHERFDGTGYPDGLKADAIPWLARLLGVAVAFAETPLEQEDALHSIRLQSGTAFDPEAVRVLMRSLPKAVLPPREREVLLSELRPGMVLAKGIYTSNGLLLIPEGQQLSAPFIDKLLNHNRINPINQSLVVYC